MSSLFVFLIVLMNLFLLTWWSWRIYFLRLRWDGWSGHALVLAQLSPVLSIGYLSNSNYGQKLIGLRYGTTAIRLVVKDVTKSRGRYASWDYALKKSTQNATRKLILFGR